MNWKDDPDLQAEMHRKSVRGRMVRSAVIWTPLFLIAAALFLFYLFDTVFNGGDRGGTWVLVVVLGVIAGLFGFQASQSLMDLRDEPVTLTGEVTRRWSRTDSLVMKSHYIRLERMILRGDAFQLAGIGEGDWVEVTYYPHSAVLVWAEKVDKPGGEVPATD